MTPGEYISDLLPCPFCGSRVQFTEAPISGEHEIECSGCPFISYWPVDWENEQIFNAWNKRHGEELADRDLFFEREEYKQLQSELAEALDSLSSITRLLFVVIERLGGSININISDLVELDDSALIERIENIESGEIIYSAKRKLK